jgi:transcriptional regulator GlxA family with amidase domain
MPHSALNEGLWRSFQNIAFAFGFGDVSHFNRVFRQRFGDTPSGVRAAATMREQK